jgi:hypothetical protein
MRIVGSFDEAMAWMGQEGMPADLTVARLAHGRFWATPMAGETCEGSDITIAR